MNQHLVYTHGYGIVMSPVNESDTRGLPDFIIKDIPPDSSTRSSINEPAIYFGERTTDYIVVDTNDETEFDYPVGDKNAFTSYNGDGGCRRWGSSCAVAFALRFGSSQIVFSNYILPESRVLFDRDVATRVSSSRRGSRWTATRIRCWSTGASCGSLTATRGSDRYPYSEPFVGTNYLRNSVKITVDAYDGTTMIYAFDSRTPSSRRGARSSRARSPTLTRCPIDIREHLRYPEGLFRVQAEVYKNYHMTDPNVFYNKEDSWACPARTPTTAPWSRTTC